MTAQGAAQQPYTVGCIHSLQSQVKVTRPAGRSQLVRLFIGKCELIREYLAGRRGMWAGCIAVGIQAHTAHAAAPS